MNTHLGSCDQTRSSDRRLRRVVSAGRNVERTALERSAREIRITWRTCARGRTRLASERLSPIDHWDAPRRAVSCRVRRRNGPRLERSGITEFELIKN
ncbi:hypothetical protein EVAR_23897_1 [Eumeta japonica]|uniref:Uncharacterized protein n=1 Tax=Eumeta variegata TaxID=151549 RepID=A0A4C1V644_EUMVA|nr:hypothetical protein EVAR_23897_1 [Eumeta japonica]